MRRGNATFFLYFAHGKTPPKASPSQRATNRNCSKKLFRSFPIYLADARFFSRFAPSGAVSSARKGKMACRKRGFQREIDFKEAERHAALISLVNLGNGAIFRV